MNIGGKASAAPVRARHYTPKEFSAELAEHGPRLCPGEVRRRCNLPASHRDHIATNPFFRGRHYIPEAELFRLAGIQEASA